jgi:hypothetical protein
METIFSLNAIALYASPANLSSKRVLVVLFILYRCGQIGHKSTYSLCPQAHQCRYRNSTKHSSKNCGLSFTPRSTSDSNTIHPASRTFTTNSTDEMGDVKTGREMMELPDCQPYVLQATATITDRTIPVVSLAQDDAI